MATQATATDKFVTVNGLRFHYLDWGNPQAPTMIMLHGLRGFAHDWDGVSRQFCDRYHILALDQRGRGETDWDPEASYYTDTYVSDLEQFVDQLNLDRFILMGQSMGGTNIIVYASRHPDKAIALIDVDAGPRGSINPGHARVGRELDNTPFHFASWDEAEALLRQQRPQISDEAMKRRLANTLKELPDGRITWTYDLEGFTKARKNPDPSRVVDLWPHVRNIQCPTLVVRGATSDVLSHETAEEMTRANERVQMVEVPDADHYVFADNLPVFNQEVTKFLDSLK